MTRSTMTNSIADESGMTHAPCATAEGALKRGRFAFKSFHLAAAQKGLEDDTVRLDASARALEIPTALVSPEAPCEVLAFGPFRFDRVRQVLCKSGQRLRMGGRAREILLALLERSGETVSKRELLERVWANGAVEEGTMRAHITALRRILGDGESGSEYVQNVPGRGYRFAAPVAYVREVSPATVTPASSSSVPVVVESSSNRARNFPALPMRMLGRAKALRTLAARVPQQRLVTIVGPGGIGKTTLALHLADTLASSFSEGVCFVDLALLREPRRVPGAVASVLGLVGLAADPLPEILSFLRDKSMLVVLDNCEHVIEVAASLVETILQRAPGVHFLATSREPLSAESESVHRLEPLAVPPGQHATGADALAFPAVQLFIQRAEASCDSFEWEDAQAPLIGEICRRLDGNPLAIKLAAERVSLLGVKGLAAILDQGLHLVIEGRRTAVPRHQTLHAMLDWSYELLSHSEQATLRRVAVFAGSFDQLSAIAMVADETVATAEVFKCLARLAAKSLIAIDVIAGKVLYRLHNTPRAYALEKLRDSGELAKTQRRHADWGRTLGTAELRAAPGMAASAICLPRSTAASPMVSKPPI